MVIHHEADPFFAVYLPHYCFSNLFFFFMSLLHLIEGDQHVWWELAWVLHVELPFGDELDNRAAGAAAEAADHCDVEEDGVRSVGKGFVRVPNNVEELM